MIHKSRQKITPTADNHSRISPMVLRYKSHVRKSIIISVLVAIIGIMLLLILL